MKKFYREKEFLNINKDSRHLLNSNEVAAKFRL